jgi:hypothetical protein
VVDKINFSPQPGTLKVQYQWELSPLPINPQA